MPAASEHGLLAKALDWIKARVSQQNELAALSQMDMQSLASDLGITEADARDVVPLMSDHSELMDRMMRARGLDPDSVRRSFSAILRDMEVTCARCRDSKVCRRELESGTADCYAHDFCPNADAMDTLLKENA